jgi:hypothetical protein
MVDDADEGIEFAQILVWNIEDGRQMNAFSCDSNRSTKASCAKFDSTWRRWHMT